MELSVPEIPPAPTQQPTQDHLQHPPEFTITSSTYPYRIWVHENLHSFKDQYPTLNSAEIESKMKKFWMKLDKKQRDVYEEKKWLAVAKSNQQSSFTWPTTSTSTVQPLQFKSQFLGHCSTFGPDKTTKMIYSGPGSNKTPGPYSTPGFHSIPEAFNRAPKCNQETTQFEKLFSSRGTSNSTSSKTYSTSDHSRHFPTGDLQSGYLNHQSCQFLNVYSNPHQTLTKKVDYSNQSDGNQNSNSQESAVPEIPPVPTQQPSQVHLQHQPELEIQSNTYPYRIWVHENLHSFKDRYPTLNSAEIASKMKYRWRKMDKRQRDVYEEKKRLAVKKKNEQSSSTWPTTSTSTVQPLQFKSQLLGNCFTFGPGESSNIIYSGPGSNKTPGPYSTPGFHSIPEGFNRAPTCNQETTQFEKLFSSRGTSYSTSSKTYSTSDHSRHFPTGDLQSGTLNHQCRQFMNYNVYSNPHETPTEKVNYSNQSNVNQNSHSRKNQTQAPRRYCDYSNYNGYEPQRKFQKLNVDSNNGIQYTQNLSSQRNPDASSQNVQDKNYYPTENLARNSNFGQNQENCSNQKEYNPLATLADLHQQGYYTQEFSQLEKQLSVYNTPKATHSVYSNPLHSLPKNFLNNQLASQYQNCDNKVDYDPPLKSKNLNVDSEYSSQYSQNMTLQKDPDASSEYFPVEVHYPTQNSESNSTFGQNLENYSIREEDNSWKTWDALADLDDQRYGFNEALQFEKQFSTPEAAYNTPNMTYSTLNGSGHYATEGVPKGIMSHNIPQPMNHDVYSNPLHPLSKEGNYSNQEYGTQNSSFQKKQASPNSQDCHNDNEYEPPQKSKRLNVDSEYSSQYSQNMTHQKDPDASSEYLSVEVYPTENLATNSNIGQNQENCSNQKEYNPLATLADLDQEDYCTQGTPQHEKQFALHNTPNATHSVYSNPLHTLPKNFQNNQLSSHYQNCDNNVDYESPLKSRNLNVDSEYSSQYSQNMTLQKDPDASSEYFPVEVHYPTQNLESTSTFGQNLEDYGYQEEDDSLKALEALEDLVGSDE